LEDKESAMKRSEKENPLHFPPRQDKPIEFGSRKSAAKVRDREKD